MLRRLRYAALAAAPALLSACSGDSGLNTGTIEVKVAAPAKMNGTWSQINNAIVINCQYPVTLTAVGEGSVAFTGLHRQVTSLGHTSTSDFPADEPARIFGRSTLAAGESVAGTIGATALGEYTLVWTLDWTSADGRAGSSAVTVQCLNVP